VLYGNSSGGVIALFTAPAREGRAELALDAGRFGVQQLRVDVAAPLNGQLDLRASASVFEWDGFRAHSAAQKKAGAVRLGWADGGDRVVLHVNALDQPADDPLGLSREQFDADPYLTAPQATQFDTRKTTRQLQAGVQWTHRFDGAGALAQSALTAYSGERAVTQWLAIPAGTQANPRHGGGVIDFDRSYGGVDARLTWRWPGVDLVTGVSAERQRDERLGFLNYTGSAAAPVYGVTGDKRRDEANRARSDDVYAQAEWQLSEAVAVVGGVRAGRVTLESADRYLSNGDDSGSRRFSFANPVLGLRWRAAPALTLHASVARGFESPTLGELAYRSDGTGGFNTDLQPQKSRQAEIGAKWRQGPWSIDAALFSIQVDDEIGVATNAGGRQSFQNVGRTRRNGGELALGWQIAPHWHAQAALSLLDAKYRDGFLACAGIPCTVPSVAVPAGNRIAGTQRGNAYAELAWQPRAGTDVGVEVRSASALTANDTNTEGAPRYTLLALRASHRYALPGGFGLDLLARVDNLADKVYAGSVIVNDANGRYYETGAPRAWWLGARLSRAF
jgi:iron complex outermembrane receptor protein